MIRIFEAGKSEKSGYPNKVSFYDRFVRLIRKHKRSLKVSCFFKDFYRGIGPAGRGCKNWTIRVSGHYGVLDVAFREDDCRARTGHAPENLSALRRLAHNSIKTHDPQSKKSVRRHMNIAGLDPDYMRELIGVVLDS